MTSLPKIAPFLFAAAVGIFYPGFLSAKGLNGTVIRVVDGDSLLVNNKGIEENVRLIGIDAPEAHDNPKAEKDAERDSEALSKVLSRGQEAAGFVGSFVHPRDKVRVETDVQQRDPYGRLLGYVFLSDGNLLNEQILQAGYAVPLAIEPNVKFQKRFEAAYVSAVKNKRGLWDKSSAKVIPAVKTRKLHSGEKGKRKGLKKSPGPQMEVSGQVDVSGQKEVSGQENHSRKTPGSKIW